jgi:hypothetical protein
MMRVAIRGGGMAATGCAHLLRRAGLAVSLSETTRPAVPAVMLSDAALTLLRDVFDRRLLFADRPRISRRMVCWGDARMQEMPHGATLVSEADLWRELGAPAEAMDGPAALTIRTEVQGEIRRFGDRWAMASEVRLRKAGSAEECRIEAVRSGWLFLVPRGAGQGVLLAIGGETGELLDESRSIAPLVEHLVYTGGPFLAAPRIAEALVGEDWLACGSAAIGFDPICGDGAAQAVREAILAAAVVTAIAEGGDREALRTHYRSMLIAAMRRHLMLCMQFYRAGGSGPWWSAQLEALADGHAWCTRQLASLPEPRFELHGFRLVPRRIAA